MAVVDNLSELTRNAWLLEYRENRQPTDDGLGSADFDFLYSNVFFQIPQDAPTDIEDGNLYPSFLFFQPRDANRPRGPGLGIFYYIKNKLDNSENLTQNELNVFIYGLAEIFKDTNLADSEGALAKLTSELLSKIVDDHNDKLLQLVSFDKYIFENYDKKVTEQMNLYLELGPQVSFLERALLRNDENWVWQTEKENENNSISDGFVKSGLVDDSFLRDSVESYTRPFSTGDLTRLTNNARLEEGSRFSSFKASNIKADQTNFIFPSYEQVDVRRAYNSFFIQFIQNLRPVQIGELSFNDRNIEALFNNSIKSYLNEEISATNVIHGWTNRDEEYTTTLKNYIAKKLLDAFRYNAWVNLAKSFKDKEPKDISAEDAKRLNAESFKEGEKAARESDLGTPTENTEDQLSEDDVEARQKFLKQCMLMTQLDTIADENLQNITNFVKGETQATSPVHKKNAPYLNRFYMVQDDPSGDQASMINKLIIPKGNTIRQFLDLKPSTHAYLVPKLRFYKIYTNNKGELSEFRFDFRNFTDPNRINNLSSSPIDRGNDFGVKQFTYSFQGTNPATARNDIKATLSLYFQTFSDFIKKRFTTSDGEKHAFVDLLLLPAGKNKNGSGSSSIFQFDAKYYRIRVDVGWEIDSARIQDLKAAIGTSQTNSLIRALKKTNKSFYLNMVDHTMDFRDDGSVQIDVDYRAYIESALKGTTMDALASRESRKALKKIREDYNTILKKEVCSAKELNEIRLQLEQIEDLFKKQSFQSIMRRLVENGTIYFKKAKDNSANNFIKRGIFTTKVVFDTETEESNTDQLLEKSQNNKQFTLINGNFSDLKNKDDFLYINYFYLGDLLFAILDSMYDEQNKYLEGYEKFKFVLGSFQYEDLLDSNAGAKTINLANIPISCELFYEWFTENIIKTERNSYPVMFFIRDLCKFLIINILSETCFKRSFDKTLQFKTMNFMGKAKNNRDPLGNLYPTFSSLSQDPIKNNLVLNVKKAHENNQLPLDLDDESDITINDLYNYVTIYVDSPRLKSNKNSRTTRLEDEKQGIMHYQIGRDRGLLKKIKFTKSDMQYIREARFFRHGQDGLMQLAAVYKVTMDMIGNTLYYPGMEVFIDPLGLFGADQDSDPRQIGSVANRLGFGGYHLVTDVKSVIAPGKFTTTVDALFSYSGDGDPSSRLIGTASEIKKSEKKKIDESPDNRTELQKNSCDAIKNQVITQAIGINEGRLTDYTSIDVRKADEIAQTQVNTQTADPLSITELTAIDGVIDSSIISPTSNLFNDNTQTTNSAFTETEVLTGRKYYDLNGKRYYEDGTNVELSGN